MKNAHINFLFNSYTFDVMESTNRYLTVIVILLVLSGCATSGGGMSSQVNNSNSVEVTDPTVDLTDYLKQVSGINVSGNGASASVAIRGMGESSLVSGPGGRNSLSSSSPLFVIDGRIVGTDYARAYQEVNMERVSSINVLRQADAGQYGSRSANGVIEINYD